MLSSPSQIVSVLLLKHDHLRPSPTLWFAASGASGDISNAAMDGQGPVEEAAVPDLIGNLPSGGTIIWYKALKHMTSTRPKMPSGPTVGGICELMVFQDLADGQTSCTLKLPYRTRAEEDLELRAQGVGNCGEAAREDCHGGQNARGRP